MDPVVAPIGDIDVAFGIDGDSPGHVKIAVTGALPAPLGQELAVLGELLDSVVSGVHHVNVVLTIEGETRRLVHFAVGIALGSPCAEPITVRGEHGDPVEPLVGHVHITRPVQGDRRRPYHGAGGVGLSGVHHLATQAAGVADLPDVVFIHRANSDSFGIGPIIVGAANHVHQVVCTSGDGNRVLEPRSSLFTPAYGVAITKRRALDSSSHHYLSICGIRHGFRPELCRTYLEIKSNFSKLPLTMGLESRSSQSSNRVAYNPRKSLLK